MNAWISSVVEALTPWKEVLGSAFAALAAVGALVSGILKQRKRTDATFTDPPVPALAGGTLRMHRDDRDMLSDVRSTIGELRDAVEDLTRVTRLNSKATEDNTEALGDNTGALSRLPRNGGRGRQ